MDNQQVILVTGCSSGFGMLAAARLAAQGHFVWATMRDLSCKQGLVNELSRRKAQASIRLLDVTKPSTIKNVVDEIKKTHFHIDVLINNAGYGIAGFFEDLSEEEIRAQLETNFFGVQSVCREVIPLMRARQQGRIINISSVAGRVATPCLGAYSASKWALEAFSESLYYELGLFGIKVVLIEPGSYPTEIFTKKAHYARDYDNPQSPYFQVSQHLKEIVLSRMKKVTRDPEEVAALIEAVINHPRPRLRYVSDPASWVRMTVQQQLPPSLIAHIFRRIVRANQ